jgi:aryl-alcohol dehydrogenase-like predicted oxidoreductase
MTDTTLPGGTFALTPDRSVPRLGYGAMQLAGRNVFGPPADRDEAIAVLREALEHGIRHLDTADFYGPYITNQLIKEALHPYADELTIVTKVGRVRDDRGRWVNDVTPGGLRDQVLSNLVNLGLDTLDVVNLRVGGADSPMPGSLAEPFGVLAELQKQGLIRHLGVSTVDAAQIAEARAIAPVVEVQNFYNIANREDDPLIDALAADGIAYVPYFPLGGFTPLQSDVLTAVGARLGTTPMSVALAWLLHRSPNILLIPGTKSRAHLRENIAAAGLLLPEAELLELEGIAG